MNYVDFFVLPLSKGRDADYKKLCEKFEKFMKPFGMISYCEAIADDVPHGKVTDFYRSVQAGDGETVVASFCTWPDKASRDKAWEAMMKDESMHGMDKTIFDGKKMFWGGFRPLHQYSK